MSKLFELRKLSDKFYQDYDPKFYPEIEQKRGRPYAVLMVIVNDVKFAIPLRTNIKHAYCYKFKATNRETISRTGIDFSKAVVIKNDRYLGDLTDIDYKEYLELRKKTYFIIKKFRQYIDGYLHLLKCGGHKYLERKYKYSTLRYFKDDLIAVDDLPNYKTRKAFNEADAIISGKKKVRHYSSIEDIKKDILK